MTNVVVELVSWLPLVRDFISFGVASMNLAVSGTIALIVIAFGWIWYRPIVGLILLVAAAMPTIIAQIRFQRSRAHAE